MLCTIIRNMSMLFAPEAQSCHQEHVSPFLLNLRNSLRELNHYISKVDERERHRNLVSCNEIR